MDQNQPRKGKKVIIDLNDDGDGINISSEDDFDMDKDSNEKKCINDHDKQNLYSHNKSFGELDVDDVLTMTFNSEKDGENFYNMYAKVVGFSVRKDDLKYDKKKQVVSRRWVCSNAGQRAKKHLERLDRQREPRAITRVGCNAAFRIKHNKDLDKWIVKNFVAEHNHPLVALPEVQFLRSHRSVKSTDKTQVKAMCGVGVKTSQVMDYMVHQSGGYENVGFIQKDLYNYVDANRRANIRDSDAEGALAYLSAKAESDPLFFYKYSVDEENRLNNLFWADSKSRLDYACFGDVLVFDTTYRTNAYKKPFVILVGVNHHNQTTVFGCALLLDETVDTYKWVLETLLEAMDNKKPISVVTDGDKAMRKAIKRIIPESRHRLCAWHLLRNSTTNVHVANFSTDFERCMSKLCTPEEFEVKWNDMVEKFGLHNNRWISEIYTKRSRWAEAYLRGQFFAGMRSIQRCESMNAYLNRFLKIRLKLYEFVQQYDRALRRIRHNETKAEYKTNHTSHVLTSALISIERHAADTFTKEIFMKFREEMKYETLFFVVNNEDHGFYRAYMLSEFARPQFTWKVSYFHNDRSIKCSCLKFESTGIPCRHIISIMKVEHLEAIPSNCIMKRWTKLAKSNIQSGHNTIISGDDRCMVRYGSLSSSCNQMCYIASQSTQCFEEAMSAIETLTNRFQELLNVNVHINATTNQTRNTEDGNQGEKMTYVRDPNFVKTKGHLGGTGSKIPRPRRCRNCKSVGHTIRKCPRLFKGSTYPDPSRYGGNHRNEHAEGVLISQPSIQQQPQPMYQHDQRYQMQGSEPIIDMTSSLYSMNAHIIQTSANTIDIANQDVLHSFNPELRNDEYIHRLGSTYP